MCSFSYAWNALNTQWMDITDGVKFADRHRYTEIVAKKQGKIKLLTNMETIQIENTDIRKTQQQIMDGPNRKIKRKSAILYNNNYLI